ncbi:hypothetical protein [Enterobacter genomosp. S]|nr:hypothetical protein [Enterobacter genomosp. S]
MEILSMQEDEAALMMLALACEGALGGRGDTQKSPQGLRRAGFQDFIG